MTPYYDHAGITIYHGDCREILPMLKADCVVTDPPYGLGIDTAQHLNAGRIQYAPIFGDDKPFDAAWICSLFPNIFLFGANNYHHTLPPGGGWAVWDKRQPSGSADKVFGWPFELAWCSKDRFGKIYRVAHGAYLNADGKQKRQHPTQKPVVLMLKILPDFEGLICDPFMGVGTTLVAAKQLGRKAIGIEIEERYCEIAVKRLGQEVMEFGEPVERMEL
jgi:site-specific DNA-methyltransferase (adenine-specific)